MVINYNIIALNYFAYKGFITFYVISRHFNGYWTWNFYVAPNFYVASWRPEFGRNPQWFLFCKDLANHLLMPNFLFFFSQ